MMPKGKSKAQARQATKARVRAKAQPRGRRGQFIRSRKAKQ